MATQNTPRKRISKTTQSKKSTSKKTSSNNKASQNVSLRREVKLVIVGFFILVAILSYYTPIFGVFGSVIKNIGLALFGRSGYCIPIFALTVFIHISIKNTLKPHTKRYIFAFSIMVIFSALCTVFAAAGDKHYLETGSLFDTVLILLEGGKMCSDGGIIGAVGIPFMMFFGDLGSRIILIFAMCVLFAAMLDFIPIIMLVALIKKAYIFIGEKFEDMRLESEDEEYEADEENDEDYDVVEDIPEPIKEEKTTPKSKKKKESVQTEIDFDAVPVLPTKKPTQKKKPEPKVVLEECSPKVPDIDIFIPIISDSSDNISTEKEEDIDPIVLADNYEVLQKSESSSPIESPKSEKKEPNKPIELTEDDFLTDIPPYKFPPISLLERNTVVKKTSGVDLREQAKTLIETLHSFGVEAKVLEVKKGPSVTRFEIQPSVGVKVSKIVNLADDIALNLAALSVRIEAPIPGKAAVGIEIPNSGDSIVRLREVLDCPEFKNFGAKTAFALGKDITGTPVVTDIAKMPHVLIAGATGSGKSVCINALITSILYKADPNDVKFIMIDPKVVELSVYNGIPHLLIPVVTDAKKAAGALNWAVQEMTKRYKLFAENNVRDIKGYNSLAQLNGEATLEHIIIIVDELADLMMVAPRDVEDAICRLAQLARAAGMHLVIATQRPSVDVVTGIIKANIPSRIAFAVSSQIDSRTILDMGGAEKLLGKGDMLFLPSGASKPTRIQGAFISDGEVMKIVDYVRCPDVKYDEDAIEKIEAGVSGEKAPTEQDADDLLPQAVEIVVEAGQASASLLQRKLSVGYARAGRLIDQLEARGIVGPHEGAKPRSVLISRAQYAEMVMQQD